MDIKNRKEELDTKVNLTLTATREEMMKRLMNDVNIIDVKVESIENF